MNNSFHSFPRLPLELRRIIWKLCLPCRIAEEDAVVFDLNGRESRQACYSIRTTRLNAQPPVIAFVNSESRQVALEEGHMLVETTTEFSMRSLWVQPHRDVLHLNWNRLYYACAMAYDPTSPMESFLWKAEELGMQCSMIAEIIHSFSLKALLDDPNSSNASDPPKNLPGEEWHILEREKYPEIAELALSTMNRCYLPIPAVLNITMAAVSLHIPKEAALKSGLFGLLGDAPIQVVDVGDRVALWEFQTLFRQYALGKEPAVQTLFDLFASSRFETAVKTWVRQAEWCIIQGRWHYQKSRDLGSTWIPYLPDIKYFSMSEYLPNENHPWVKEARQDMPKLRPRIMVRYCSNECYIKERLPEHFWKY
ncbi:uncharacterized protein TRUGW13939_01139 [Talaromyces rugulosus]|uniref:2EXR domain-containing protein n=1 Tax=Talaromyces rugulosus TaxID=121627 RepID=A0A7H8QJI2_TALRU|nr:uncharacterized protein TRUGW13939_01139 [Talaromyces rugulosus]QKX54056.1 hypothetical protein TRUGW13939_01139 [Talaromyces rugulosus]